MPRVIGVDIPANKPLLFSLTYIYGVGRVVAKRLLDQVRLDPTMRAKNLTESDLSKLNTALQSDDYVVEGDLRRQVQGHIRRLISINCYRGRRHKLGLPVRGQRTRCNARCRKGKKTAVANKRRAPGPK